MIHDPAEFYMAPRNLHSWGMETHRTQWGFSSKISKPCLIARGYPEIRGFTLAEAEANDGDMGETILTRISALDLLRFLGSL